MIINHNCCIQLVPLVIFIYDAWSHIHPNQSLLLAECSKKKTIFTSKLDLNLRKKLIKFYIWSMALYGAETWTLRAADQKYLENFEMWCWRKMEKLQRDKSRPPLHTRPAAPSPEKSTKTQEEKICWTDHVRNE